MCVHVGISYTSPVYTVITSCVVYTVNADEYGCALPSHTISITLHFLPEFTGMSTCAVLNLLIKISLLHH